MRRTPASAVDVVAAVPFVLDDARALAVRDFEEQCDVRVRDTHFLHDALDAHRLREVELRCRVVSQRRRRERRDRN